MDGSETEALTKDPGCNTPQEKGSRELMGLATSFFGTSGDSERPSVVRVKVIVKVIDLQTSSQRDLSYMALT